jgi:asparagine synthase (glutamine-hydrolysing)
MSALCGIIQCEGHSVALPAINQMMNALEAYGPNGSSIWHEGSVALGHQMLHVTPESLQECLPWQDGLTGLVITADARLDNRAELFAALNIPPSEGQHFSDSQLILRAYRKWGEQCPQHLLGDFAFAIWDERDQKLFCARDIFGVRPFFYYHSSNCFFFASDLNALLAVPEIPQQFNEILLAAFLQQEDIMFAQKSQTFYDGIYKLPPAHCLTLTSRQHTIQSYWSVNAVSEINLKSEGDYIAMLQDLFEQAVSCRLRSAFPMGTHLSGGLDSSAIAVTAARGLKHQGKTSQAFSWSPPLDTCLNIPGDERGLVEAICQREQIACHYLNLTGEDLLNFRSRSFFCEPTEMLQFEQKVQTQAAAQNVRTILSGWGGDEAITFNGRGYFAELFLRGHWWTLYRELKLRGQLHGIGLKGQLKSKVLAPLLPDFLAMRLEALTNKYFQPPGRSAYIHPQLAQKFKANRAKLPHLPYLLRERSGVRKNQRMLLEYGHLTNRIEAWALSGGQKGLVYSYPLLDRRIVEFALGIPVNLFFKQGWKRYIFRSATKDLLPDQIRWNKTKRESATVANIHSCQDEIATAWEEMKLARLEKNQQSQALAQFIDMERLESALTKKESHQIGFTPAVLLLNSFPRDN